MKTEKNVTEVTLESDEETGCLSPGPVTTTVAANPLSAPLYVSASNIPASAAAFHHHGNTPAPIPAAFHLHGNTPAPVPATFHPNGNSSALMSPQSTASSSVSNSLLSTSKTRTPHTPTPKDSHSHHSRRRHRSRSPSEDG